MIDEQLGMMPFAQETTNPKELFDLKDVEGRTELSAKQVMIVAKMSVLGDEVKNKHGINTVNTFIQTFLKLQISKDRGSRKEFVSAFQSKNDERAGGLLDKFSMNIGQK